MKTSIKPIAILLVIAVFGFGGSGCSTAKITRQQSLGAASATKPAIVYVSDFDLAAADIHSEPGLLPAPSTMPGPLGDLLPRRPGSPKDPQELARELVDEMSDALVKDLTKAGFVARRIRDTKVHPASGWLLRGVFTSVNQGNQLRRAAIGLGQGETELQVMVDLADLSHGTPTPFYELSVSADSGKGPGSAPMAMRFPAAVAVRFVLSGKDLERNVKQTASKIAEEVAERAKVK